MQFPQHGREGGSPFRRRRRISDEMVVIGEDGPCLEVPAVGSRNGEQPSMQDLQTVNGAEVMRLSEGRCGDEVGSGITQPMGWRVRPMLFGHGTKFESVPAPSRVEGCFGREIFVLRGSVLECVQR